jgi:release factor glutamine methyltransferase
VWASDISPAALEVAALNVGAHGLEGRVHLACGDMMDPLPGRFDVVCANLPYLSPAAKLPAEVVAQPATALYAEGDGVALVSRLIDESPDHLVPGGRVLAELDPSILDAVTGAARLAFESQRVHRDLGGHERVLEAWSFIPTNSGRSAGPRA